MSYKTLREQIFYPLLGSATLAVAIETLSLLTDNIIVGRVVGETGLAGINMVVPLLLRKSCTSISCPPRKISGRKVKHITDISVWSC